MFIIVLSPWVSSFSLAGGAATEQRDGEGPAPGPEASYSSSRAWLSPCAVIDLAAFGIGPMASGFSRDGDLAPGCT